MTSAAILIVDDEEIVRESYKLALSKAGYEVCAVSNGHDALQACRTGHFDLMLADIRLPDMDGLEVARVVVGEFPEIGVVVITGYPSPESLERARRLGVVDYVEKPLEPDQLNAVISAALTRPRLRLPEQSPASAPGKAALDREPASSSVPEDVAPSEELQQPVPVSTAPTVPPPGTPPTEKKDISALTALLVMLSAPLIGLAFFILFPLIATGIALGVLGKELWKLVRR